MSKFVKIGDLYINKDAIFSISTKVEVCDHGFKNVILHINGVNNIIYRGIDDVSLYKYRKKCLEFLDSVVNLSEIE